MVGILLFLQLRDISIHSSTVATLCHNRIFNVDNKPEATIRYALETSRDRPSTREPEFLSRTYIDTIHKSSSKWATLEPGKNNKVSDIISHEDHVVVLTCALRRETME